MTTCTGSGASVLDDPKEAAIEAITTAKASLGGQAIQFGLIFAGPRYPLSEVLAAAREAAGVDMLGCTTAGEFTEKGLTHNGIAAFLIASDEILHSTGFADNMKAQPAKAASILCQPFRATKRLAFKESKIRSTTLLLTDGLSGKGEKALRKISEQTSAFQQIVGGAAGDEGAFKETQVGVGESAAADAMAAVHVFSKKIWGVGVGHGLRPASDKMRVTKAVGNVVYELDGQPAFDIYKQHAKERGVTLSPDAAGSYMIGNELGIYFFNRICKARAPLSVGTDGSLSCAADIPQGSSVAILDGEPTNMVEAAQQAATEAKNNLGKEKCAGVVLFDCVCRGMILEDQFQKEIDAVRGVFGDVPITGFLTYGEIARYKGTLGGWHNTTAVVLAIPA